jgi:hypothetical protein
MAYAPDFYELGRRAASSVDKILNTPCESSSTPTPADGIGTLLFGP